MPEPWNNQSVYFIDNDVQQRLLGIKESMDEMEAAYRAWDAGQATIHPKTNIYIYNDDDTHYSFSTIQGGVQPSGIVAIRIKSDLQRNRRPSSDPWMTGSAPTSVSKQAGREGAFCGLVYLFSARTGLPLAILNDGYLQHVRVGASAGIAAKYLARENAETLCLLGSQWMARTHAPAICAVRPIKRIKVYSPDREHRESFAREMAQKLEIEVQAYESPEQAVRDSDVVCCCTNSFRRPALLGKWLEPGMYISNVLSSELDDQAVAQVNYTVKNQPLRRLEDHIHEAGSLPEGADRPNEGTGWLRQVNDQTPLLSAVVAGKARGRSNESEITFFSNNEGTGIQFASVGSVILSRLQQEGDAGVKKVPLDWFLQDIPD